ncbi:hypothetical protein PSQ19_16400 [Devosia algicola]|uniref:Uncharacterized protein n=1 Tax=Devosia algicola TaxID=3026418 RepID=A0ABY7YLX3_9HYPH|nr:hypothetical protein [Devosia algicola]WDR02209.1 hypothetical protein PSQ19_16400 [Devosia algicola]
MKEDANHNLEVGHPAAMRHRISPVLLGIAIAAAPTGWMVQLLFAFASTSYVCVATPNGVVPAWLMPVLVALNLLGLALAVAGAILSAAIVKRTTLEQSGTTRFLANWGIFVSLAFFAATFANSFSLFLVPLCKT